MRMMNCLKYNRMLCRQRSHLSQGIKHSAASIPAEVVKVLKDKNMKNLLTANETSIDKSKILAMVLHCCDISHPAKRWNLHQRWTMLLLEEFFRQGDLEHGPPTTATKTKHSLHNRSVTCEVIDENESKSSNDKPTVPGAEPDAPNSGVDESTGPASSAFKYKFKIRKPWLSCLADNKKIWKEQAIKDAAAKAASEETDKPAVED
ncbi:hypothetical protein EVAR_73381_1 [Eumeta japonica]|uniref:PDEase domain-containing protein n=1 Tax=Eumeta variegata TaxID=151549 RepID=A0A4C1SLN6_EUMVA|nr:hypothetical protein EVAR_73381_1 [Eumeta japonica]